MCHVITKATTEEIHRCLLHSHLREQVVDRKRLRMIAQHLEGIALCREVLLGLKHLHHASKDQIISGISETASLEVVGAPAYILGH